VFQQDLGEIVDQDLGETSINMEGETRKWRRSHKIRKIPKNNLRKPGTRDLTHAAGFSDIL
jgi:hypothetical protein